MAAADDSDYGETDAEPEEDYDEGYDHEHYHDAIDSAEAAVNSDLSDEDAASLDEDEIKERQSVRESDYVHELDDVDGQEDDDDGGGFFDTPSPEPQDDEEVNEEREPAREPESREEPEVKGESLISRIGHGLAEAGRAVWRALRWRG